MKCDQSIAWSQPVPTSPPEFPERMKSLHPPPPAGPIQPRAHCRVPEHAIGASIQLDQPAAEWSGLALLKCWSSEGVVADWGV